MRSTSGRHWLACRRCCVEKVCVESQPAGFRLEVAWGRSASLKCLNNDDRRATGDPAGREPMAADVEPYEPEGRTGGIPDGLFLHTCHHFRLRMCCRCFLACPLRAGRAIADRHARCIWRPCLGETGADRDRGAWICSVLKVVRASRISIFVMSI